MADANGKRVCVFDAYGTLFDVGAAARQAAAEPGFESSRSAGPRLQKTGVRDNSNTLGSAVLPVPMHLSGR